MWRNKQRMYFTQEMEVTFNLLWILWWFRFLLPTVYKYVCMCAWLSVIKRKRRNKSLNKFDKWQSILGEKCRFIRFIQSFQFLTAAHWLLALLSLVPDTYLGNDRKFQRLWTQSSFTWAACLIYITNVEIANKIFSYNTFFLHPTQQLYMLCHL